MSRTFFEGRFDGIQALRGLAAFSVLINHMAFIENGGFGVDIFFCISGFIMMYITNGSAKNFMMKRLIRIVPLYYIMTFATYAGAMLIPSLFESTAMSPVYLIKSLLFIPFDIGNSVQPIVRVGWTLNYEVFFYVIIWISLHISNKYRGVIASGVLIILAITGALSNGLSEPFDFWTNSIIVEFIYGILAYEIVSRAADSVKSNNSIRICCVISALICYVLMWTVKYNDVLSGMPRFLIYGIPAFVMFVAVFIATYGVSLPKIIVYLGDISYSVYLIHYFIVRLFNHYICPDGIADFAAISGGLGVIVITIAVSTASYLIIEKRGGRALTHALDRLF